MKAKTIKATIEAKFEDWLNSIEDTKVREMAKNNTIISGGCIASMLLQEDVNDFDLYFRNLETTKAIAEYYVSKFKPPQAGIPCPTIVYVEKHVDGTQRVKIVVKSSGIASERPDRNYAYFESLPDGEAGKYLAGVLDNPADVEDAHEALQTEVNKSKDSKKYTPLYLTSNAITLWGKVQIVLRFFGEPDEIHANFDYVHCTNYWTSWDKRLVLRPDALEMLLTRELRYVGSRYPICSIIRMRKFIRRGWTINAGQVLKMCFQVGALDLTDINVLEEQLTGVDAAYFVQLVDRLREKDASKVDAAYLVELVDRIF